MPNTDPINGYYPDYVHNSGMVPRNQSMDKTKYTAWLNNIWIRPETKAELRRLRLDVTADFDTRSFNEKHLITGKATQNIYYRKISEGEFSALQPNKQPFKPVLDYKNTRLYRYWISSSLKKVNAFSNDSRSDDGDIIIKIEFNQDPRVAFDVRAHQCQGVQENANVVALHREGFAELGNINTHEQVNEIITGNYDHNLGFTSEQLPLLNSTFKSWERIS